MKLFYSWLLGLVCAVPLQAQNWPAFRGEQAAGIAEGHPTAVLWDGARGTNIKWKTPIPGLSHASPVGWGQRVFLITAVSLQAGAAFQTRTDSNDPVPDSRYRWMMYCLDKTTGRVLWSKVAHEGLPRVKRHLKATQANATPATDGRYVVALFGSEGLFCFDMKGRLLWKQDVGVLDAGLHEDKTVTWGHAASPIIYRDLVIVQADGHAQSFLAAWNLKTGKRVWRVVAALPKKGERLHTGHRGLGVQLLNIHHGRSRPVENLGFIIEIAGKRILHIGDSEAEPAVFQKYEVVKDRIDVVFLPFWYFLSDDFKRAVREQIQSRHIVVMHIETDRLLNRVRSGSWEKKWAPIKAEFPNTVYFVQELEKKGFD
jgi:hypothetical protein